MSIATVTRVLAIAMAAAAVLAIAVAIARCVRARKTGGSWRLGKLGVVCVALVTVLAAANVAVYLFNNIVSQYLSTSTADASSVEEATQQAMDVSARVEAEGAVLLKNDGALPLAGKKVNVFGISSQKLVYGGSGSGASDESDNVTLAQGLSEAGIEVNADLQAFYQEHLPEQKKTNIFSLTGGDYNIYEPDVSAYSDELLSGAKQFSSTAIFVVSRSGGEGGDLPIDMAGYEGGDAGKHYLELQDSERALLDLVKSNFDEVIVLVNSSNAMELGFVDDDAVDACLWIGGPGAAGCRAVGQILAGETNPSGRLADTYAYDVTSSPAYYNAGDFTYTKDGADTGESYVEYAEGIYVGYRYYETAAADGYIDYDQSVQFPFGYGLSYTTFEQQIVSHDETDGKVTVRVKLTNTGSVAGKDVAQLYLSAPYTTGGIEKSAVELAAFSKTKLLEPGESQELELSFSLEDFASFDYLGQGRYVLEAGTYAVSLRSNSHDVIDQFDVAVDATVTYGENSSRAGDVTAAQALFSDAAGDITYVSRADWAATMPTQRVESKEATNEILYELNKDNINALYCSDDPAGEAVSTSSSLGLKLEDLVGTEANDSRWSDIVSQMSVDDMKSLIGYGGFSTVAVESVGKVKTTDIDGPAGLNALTSSISGVQYPSEVVIASTWNAELAQELGQVYASEANAHGVNGVYAPAANIHRTPFSGRNFEYYSEDPVLSGYIGAAEVRGIRSRNICTYVKHFALNDQETNRSGVAVWSNEQAIREIYLKSFEIIVKQGGTDAIMTSYNRIGTVWAGGSKALINGALRGEWGFDGVVVTDYDNGGYMNPDQALRAGGDLMLSTTGDAPTEVTTGSDYGIGLMQESCARILRMVANSRAYSDPVAEGFPVWLAALAGVDALVVALTALRLVSGAKPRQAARLG